MNRRIYLITALSALVLLGSCKKFLTIKPLDSVDVGGYYKTAKDLNATLAGMYQSFQAEMTGDGTGFTGRYFYWGEARSDNFAKGQYGGGQETELELNAITSGNKTSNWEGLFRTIARANNGLKYFPLIPQTDPTVTPTVVNSAMAQAYAMRAMCYFYIVRLWGDAPIRLVPYEDLSTPSRQPRESKTKIMDEVIIPDLEKALDLIPKNQTANVWNINEGAILAMLADVHMWKAGTLNNTAEYSTAKTYMERLFSVAKGATGAAYGSTNVNLEPAATWKNMFLTPAASKEAIWSIHWDNMLNGCACLPTSIGKSNNPLRVDSSLHANWQKNTADIRVKLSYDIVTGSGHVDKIFKYYITNAANTGFAISKAEDNAAFLVMYRLSDMFLLYAEALNKLNDGPNSLKYLNYIHQRAGLPAIPVADVSTGGAYDQVKLEDAILQERQWELFGEGKRWFDLVRTGHVNKVMDPIIKDRIRRLTGSLNGIGFGSNPNKILWPLYKTLLEDNRLLIQNPSYE